MGISGLFNRIMGKIADDTNRIMLANADILVQELKEECPKKTGATAASMRILGQEEGMQAGLSAGLITKVTVGSTLRTAYWADQGNDGQGSVIYPKHARSIPDGRPPVLGKWDKGIPGIGWRPYVRAYEGDHYVTRVANRHR